VLNDVTKNGAGFDVDTNIVTIIDENSRIDDYPLMSKLDVANVILDRMLELKK
jgi:phosphopantothenoylcysteine decarboxylase/phosphopantothenate--cysteine ligase